MNTEQTIKWLYDKALIEQTILKYATAADLRDWDLLKSILSDEVYIDFTTSGGPSMTVTNDQYIGQVTSLIPGFNVTQHQLTNFVIDINGDTANTVVYMQAEHFVQEGTSEIGRTIGGYYTHKLKKENGNWKICSLKLTATWGRGDMRAFEIANKRANS
ncbi:nuclear transport factor 2 family protein [Chakrabartyella piscis]|uniref:nuclear transport factor 2 family protein n=1 Tax=Chakrabartyella piscis TaxID=2918914 RepID=UPI00295867CC|nr:nuclear transport factor 2 family protein [Chakrabartyella piscis]